MQITEIKQCKKCSFFKPLQKFEQMRSRSGQKKLYHINTCRKCRKVRESVLKPVRKENSFQRLKKWKESNRGTIEGFIYSNLHRWRKRSVVDSDLTFDYLISLWNKQSGKCFYTKVSLDNISPGTTRKQLTLCNRLMNSPSLDKLYPEKGYIKGNVVWCSYSINSMKWDRTYDEFLSACTSIIEGSSSLTLLNGLD